MKGGVRGESGHLPLEVKLYGQKPEREKEQEEKWIKERIWNEEGIKKYHEKCENWQGENEEVSSKWENIKEKVKEAIPVKEIKIKTWKMEERE